MLVRFRSYKIGLTTDIEKAFHQIEVKVEDRDMLRFLWWDDVFSENPKIQQYRFRCLVFGLTPSPAILNGVIQHHLNTHREKSPDVVKIFATLLYVDDFLGGSASEEEGLELYQQAIKIMKSSGFNLRKWTPNCKVLQDQIIQSEDITSSKPPDNSVKILGVNWNTQNDDLFFDLSELINIRVRCYLLKDPC